MEIVSVSRWLSYNVTDIKCSSYFSSFMSAIYHLKRKIEHYEKKWKKRPSEGEYCKKVKKNKGVLIFFIFITTISFIDRLLLCVPFIGSWRTSRPAWTTRNSWLTRFPRLPREKWKTGTKRNKRPAGSPGKTGCPRFAWTPWKVGTT